MHQRARQGYEDLLAAEYRKSTYSSGAQECVAIGYAADLAGVKDTKNGMVLAVPSGRFAQFVRAAKLGHPINP